ncbi:ParB/RepB/Spo0J family partition protein [Geobacillus stearothermophilus]|uniref:ParB/RepB/Spo0J family partition protein n=1 Tax=Geobacillus stearothermophilus TaxID=1422 RepID=UPI002E2132D0|nr:ParB/RepB/Spo0J family partition protein [Geobacillus stearothermophilus]MED3754151.1 ParB/RepB/Spo0J family partition protein [Geobacillus stearothermophilus]
MVGKESQQVQKINAKLAGGFKLAIVPIDQLEFLEKNARFMKNETFQNLVNNIKRDGGLSQLPFCWLTPEGKYRILSGNHRCKAAIEAGLTEVPVIYTDRDLTRDEQIAIQLSHNAITGEDDPVILQELYAEIEDLEMKYYSGLDDKVLDQLEKVQIDGITEARLDYLTVSFLFLPEERDELFRVFEEAKETISDETVLARLEDFDRLLEAQKKVKQSYNIFNGATSLMIILDIFERHLEDLREGYLDENGEPEHKNHVPIASVLGSDEIPAEAAATLNKAIEKALSSGEIDKKEKWKLIESLATKYLSGE